MLRYIKPFLLNSLLIGILLLPCTAFATENNSSAEPVYPAEETTITTERMGVDALVARPLGLISTLGGSVLFLISSPFSAMGGNIDEAWDMLVAEPASYTFSRPLGHFEGEEKKEE